MLNGMSYIIPPQCDTTVPLLGPFQLKGFADEISYSFKVHDLNISFLEMVVNKALLDCHEEIFISDYDSLEISCCKKYIRKSCDQFRIKSYIDLLDALKNCKKYVEYWKIIDLIRACYDLFSYAFLKENIRFRLDGIDYYDDNQLLTNVNKLYKTKLMEWLNSQLDMFFDDYKDIGINITFESQLVFAVLIAKALKDRNSEKRIFVGGGFINSNVNTVEKAEAYKRFFDVICYGEGEPLLWRLANEAKILSIDEELVHNLHSGWINSETITNNKFHISPPAFTKLNHYFSPSKIIPLRLTSACYWNKCKFCVDEECSNTLLLKKYQYQDMTDYGIALIQQEMIDGIYFLDSAIPIQYLIRFCEKIIANGLKCKWGTNLRFEKELTDSNTIDLFARAGCAFLRFGLESGSQRVIYLMNKGIDVNDASRIITLCRNYNILVHTYIMVGYPGETKEDREQTEKFILNENTHPDNYSCSEFVLYPNSLIAKEIEESNNRSNNKNDICNSSPAQLHAFVSDLRAKFDSKFQPTNILFSPGHTISFGNKGLAEIDKRICLKTDTTLTKSFCVETYKLDGCVICAVWHRRDGVVMINLDSEAYHFIFENAKSVYELVEFGLNTNTIYTLINNGFLEIDFKGEGSTIMYDGPLSIEIITGNIFNKNRWYGNYDAN